MSSCICGVGVVLGNQSLALGGGAPAYYTSNERNGQRCDVAHEIKVLHILKQEDPTV